MLLFDFAQAPFLFQLFQPQNTDSAHWALETRLTESRTDRREAYPWSIAEFPAKGRPSGQQTGNLSRNACDPFRPLRTLAPGGDILDKCLLILSEGGNMKFKLTEKRKFNWLVLALLAIPVAIVIYVLLAG